MVTRKKRATRKTKEKTVTLGRRRLMRGPEKKAAVRRVTAAQKRAATAKKCLRLQELQNQAKAMYVEMDTLLSEIKNDAGVGKTIKLGGGATAVVEDLFAERDIQWKSVCSRRYKLSFPT